MSLHRLLSWQALGVVGIGVILAAFSYSWLADAQENRELPLEVTQRASAEVSGVRITVEAAAFSGTATYLRVSASAPDDSVREIRINPEDYSFEGAVDDPDAPPISLLTGKAVIVRLPPIIPDKLPELVVTNVALVRGHSSDRRDVSGVWRLALQTPEDLASRLRVSSPPGGSDTDAGITVTVTSVRQSTSETIVAVRVGAESSVWPLGQPRLYADNAELYGELIDRSGDGQLLYRFPPTSPGQQMRIVFEGFVEPGATKSGTVTLDVQRIISRAGISPREDRRASIEAFDILASSGTVLPTEFQFQQCTATKYPGMKCAILIVDGAVDLTIPSRSPAITARTGDHQFPTKVQATGWNRNAAGAITGNGWTAYGIYYSDLAQLEEPITFTIDAREATTRYGFWEVPIG